MSHDTTLDADLALANRLADAAAGISLSFFRRDVERWSKSDGSLVTKADVAVETELRDRLRRERPNDAVLGEEQGQAGTSERRWIIDAIDGTVDFAAGGPDWGLLIALEADGRIVLGVCDQPVHKRRYWGGPGKRSVLRRFIRRREAAESERRSHAFLGSQLRAASRVVAARSTRPPRRESASRGYHANPTRRAPGAPGCSRRLRTGGVPSGRSVGHCRAVRDRRRGRRTLQ